MLFAFDVFYLIVIGLVLLFLIYQLDQLIGSKPVFTDGLVGFNKFQIVCMDML